MKNAFGEVKRGLSKVEEIISKFEDMLIGTLKNKIQREENEKNPEHTRTMRWFWKMKCAHNCNTRERKNEEEMFEIMMAESLQK